MIRISRLADYAIVILAHLLEADEALVKTSSVSARTSLPEPTVAKILKMLAKAGLLDSVRGAGGGYRMNAPAEEISISRIIEAIDGPIALTACVEGHEESCAYQRHCPVKGRWNEVNNAIYETIDKISLADMVRPKTMMMNKKVIEENHERL